MRSVLYCLLFGFSIATASAQERLALGTYTAPKEGQSATGVDLVVKHITADGRITGTIREHGAGPMCGMPLAANGTFPKDGGIRIEVNDGAPEGCERVYLLERTADGGLSGTVVRGEKRSPIQFARR